MAMPTLISKPICPASVLTSTRSSSIERSLIVFLKVPKEGTCVGNGHETKQATGARWVSIPYLS